MDVLPPLVPTPQGTSAANIVLAPILGNIVPLLWVYKLIYPLLFALVPVITYHIFQRWLTAKQAFLASFALIVFPSFFMELPAVVRHMTAELLLVTLLFLIFKSKLKVKYAIPVVALLGALMAVSYYTVTIISATLLGAGLTVSLFLKYKRLLMGIALASMVITGVMYYPLVEEGAVALKLGHLYNAFAPAPLELNVPKMRAPRPVIPTKRMEVINETTPQLGIVDSTVESNTTVVPGTSEAIVELTPPDVWASKVPYLRRLGPLLRSAIGFDFVQQPITGKVFRVLQWLFMLLIPIGLWRLRRNKGYLMFASGGVFLLTLLLIPGFMGLLSLTRVVHMALLTLAPAVAISLKPKYLLLILIPYFLFTSGLIFEVTKQPNIEKITIPYSYGLSNYRIDLGASIDDDDYNVRQYIYDNALFPIYLDINSSDFMGEVIGWRSTWNRALRTYYGVNVPEEGYFFLNSRNIQDGTVTLWTGAGQRKQVPISLFVDDPNENIVYQSGDSRVLEVK
ncbi:hypothetical protein LCGC14_1322160, partial [marine sediment metagenome]